MLNNWQRYLMGETMRKILAGLFFACLILPTQVYSKCLNLAPNDHCKKYAVDGLDKGMKPRIFFLLGFANCVKDDSCFITAS